MKILIVDDQKIVRVAFTRFLKGIFTNTYSYDEASNGSEALEKLNASRFDLVLLDISMPIMDGYEACKLIRRDYPALPIVMLTQFYDHRLINHFYGIGVQSFITKNSSTSELTSAINCALKGEKFFPEQIKGIIECAERKKNTGRIEFAPQEKKLIQLLHLGLTSKEIAQQMGLTIKTVRTYRERLMEKTNTSNTVQLVSFGFRIGLLHL